MASLYPEPSKYWCVFSRRWTGSCRESLSVFLWLRAARSAIPFPARPSWWSFPKCRALMGKLRERSLFCICSQKGNESGYMHTHTITCFPSQLLFSSPWVKVRVTEEPQLWSVRWGSLAKKYWWYVFKEVFTGIKDSLLGSFVVLLRFTVCDVYFKPKQTSKRLPLDGVRKMHRGHKNNTPKPRYYKSNL